MSSEIFQEGPFIAGSREIPGIDFTGEYPQDINTLDVFPTRALHIRGTVLDVSFKTGGEDPMGSAHRISQNLDNLDTQRAAREALERDPAYWDSIMQIDPKDRTLEQRAYLLANPTRPSFPEMEESTTSLIPEPIVSPEEKMIDVSPIFSSEKAIPAEPSGEQSIHDLMVQFSQDLQSTPYEDLFLLQERLNVISRMASEAYTEELEHLTGEFLSRIMPYDEPMSNKRDRAFQLSQIPEVTPEMTSEEITDAFEKVWLLVIEHPELNVGIRTAPPKFFPKFHSTMNTIFTNLRRRDPRFIQLVKEVIARNDRALLESYPKVTQDLQERPSWLRTLSKPIYINGKEIAEKIYNDLYHYESNLPEDTAN